MSKLVVFLAVLDLTSALLRAQYPGQAPPPGYPPGQYPPGQAPVGGSGIPIPSRHKGQKQADAKQPTLSAEGRTISNNGKMLVIATNDGRTLTMTVTSRTQFTQSGKDIASSKVIPRSTVRIEAGQDDEWNLFALNVELLKEAPSETAAKATTQPAAADSNQTDETGPPNFDNPDDAPGRPILRRRLPKKSSSDEASGDNADTPQTRTNKPSSKGSVDQQEATEFTIDSDSDQSMKNGRSPSNDLVAKTKEWALTFTNGLPNYFCQQMTTRYMEYSRSSGWEPQDVVTAKVVYEDGTENYRDITVGGKKTNKSMLELGGSTSTGEFASTLRSVFSDSSQADFKLFESTTLRGSPASIYDFQVALPNSDWTIKVGGQTLRPAYKGSVWIDRATSQVRRIEMQAENIPQDFPLDSIEWAVDYDEVQLGTAKFLLPVHAENLDCERGTSICAKNTVDFRDYHKYSGESNITFH